MTVIIVVDVTTMIIYFYLVLASYPNYVLAGGDRQTDQAGAIYRHDTVTDAQLAAALRRTSVKEVGHHHSGQDGAPA